MANITKTLNGLVTLTPLAAQIYDFVVPNPNTLNVEVLNEVYIHCDSTAGIITINLPNIASIGSFSPKVYIVDVASAATANDIVIVADPGAVGPPVVLANTINGIANYTISTNDLSVCLSIVSATQWHLN
jgi:hypothetical protein